MCHEVIGGLLLWAVLRSKLLMMGREQRTGPLGVTFSDFRVFAVQDGHHGEGCAVHRRSLEAGHYVVRIQIRAGMVGVEVGRVRINLSCAPVCGPVCVVCASPQTKECPARVLGAWRCPARTRLAAVFASDPPVFANAPGTC